MINVAKYANASAAELSLHGDDQWAEIAVANDGVGGARTDAGSGLRGLCDRVEALGGQLTLASAAGAGTTVRARVPITTKVPRDFSSPAATAQLRKTSRARALVMTAIHLRRATVDDVECLVRGVIEGVEDYPSFAPDGWSAPSFKAEVDQLPRVARERPSVVPGR